MSEESNGAAPGDELVVVDLNKRQSKKRIKNLRKGRGKLLGQINDVISELQEAGTIGANAQPVVVVVREKPEEFDLRRVFRV